MWNIFFWISVGIIMAFTVLAIVLYFVGNKIKHKNIKIIYYAIAGVFIGSIFMFMPIHLAVNDSVWQSIFLSLFNSMQIFALGCEFNVVNESTIACPAFYQVYASFLFVIAPVLTFGFVFSFFRNSISYIKYHILSFFKDTYVFSELNEKSISLALDVKRNDKKAAIVFTDVFESNDELLYELSYNAKKFGAMCFKKDVLAVDFKRHSKHKNILFFTIGKDETENLNQAIKLIDMYKGRKNTAMYVFSTGTESELLLSDKDKGNLKVIRVNEVKSLIRRILYENGKSIFDSAKERSDGIKQISACVIGMGKHGTEMVKSLAWFCQMDGYDLKINAFDADALAEDKFRACAPDLMSPLYNGVLKDGESQYDIKIHSGIDVETETFAKAIQSIKDVTYVMVALGKDSLNIKTAINLRMYFERMKIHPIIQVIVYNSQQKNALSNIKNYQGQSYDIDFIGDIASSYTKDVIMDLELEKEALEIHKKWGKEEEEFWNYEYNYGSSFASAIHLHARIICGIEGAEKKEENKIESLEHRRWNAYLRSEGYVYSGSRDRESRNDLAKTHNGLVDEDSKKEKDIKVGTK